MKDADSNKLGDVCCYVILPYGGKKPSCTRKHLTFFDLIRNERMINQYHQPTTWNNATKNLEFLKTQPLKRKHFTDYHNNRLNLTFF